MSTTELFGDQPIPKNALRALGAVVVLSLGLAAFGRYTGIGTSHVAITPVTQTLALKFEDARDGSVLVTQEPGARQIAVLAPGTNGFIRGTVRGLVRGRKIASIGPELPFLLERHDNGDLTLRDPANGRQLELKGFGVTNIGAFEKIMQAGEKNG